MGVRFEFVSRVEGYSVSIESGGAYGVLCRVLRNIQIRYKTAIFGGIFWLLGFFGIPLLLAAIGSLV